jgi:hypothetical protein
MGCCCGKGSKAEKQPLLINEHGGGSGGGPVVPSTKTQTPEKQVKLSEKDLKSQVDFLLNEPTAPTLLRQIQMEMNVEEAKMLTLQEVIDGQPRLVLELVKHFEDTLPASSPVHGGKIQAVPLPLDPPPPPPVPQRFIDAEEGDETKANENWVRSLQWREENDIDGILKRPHRNFDLLKQHYTHGFHGRDHDGWPVYYEKVGQMQLSKLQEQGITSKDLKQHYLFLTEFCWSTLERSEDARCTTVLDVAGIRIQDMGGEVLTFICDLSQLITANYPERVADLFIVNVPVWFREVWDAVLGAKIAPSTRERTRMLKGKKAIKTALSEFIDLDQLPKEYGGACETELGDSEEEAQLRLLVERIACKSPSDSPINSPNGEPEASDIVF